MRVVLSRRSAWRAPTERAAAGARSLTVDEPLNLAAATASPDQRKYDLAPRMCISLPSCSILDLPKLYVPGSALPKKSRRSEARASGESSSRSLSSSLAWRKATNTESVSE